MSATEIESKEIRIKKVKKSSKGVVTIVYQRANGDEWDDYSLACKSEPHPDLLAVLSALVPSVVEICELPMGYEEGLIVSGVSFSYSNDNMGAVITSQKTLKTHPAPLILNTPHKPVAPYSEGGDDACLSSKTVMMLDALQNEAKAYIDGKRGTPVKEEAPDDTSEPIDDQDTDGLDE